MPQLTDFAITRRWPPRDPGVIQLYSVPTPNGAKISVALEELGLPYDAHRISFADKDQFTPEFLAISPGNKIPALIDPDGPDGQAIALFESGAILLYLAEKTGRLIPANAHGRWEVLKWLFFQMGGVGPMFGQLGYFHKFDGRLIEDKRPHERYRAEAQRLLGVLERQLDGRDWVAGDYSIADIALGPWVRGLNNYGVAEITGLDRLVHVPAWLERFLARDAVQRGLTIPA